MTSPVHHCSVSSGLLKQSRAIRVHRVLGAKAFVSHALLMLFLHPGDQQVHPDHHHPLLHKVSLSSRCEGDIPLPLGHPARSEAGPGSHNSHEYLQSLPSLKTDGAFE